MGTDSVFLLMTKGLMALFTAHGGLFIPVAASWVTASIVLRLIRVGADAALFGEWDGQGFIRLVGRILFVSIVVNGWNTPIWLIGRSASHLVTDETESLAKQIEDGSGQAVQDRLNKAYASIERPTLLSPIADTVYYVAVVFAIAALQAVLLGVTSIAFLATGICVLIGPLAVAALMWPATEHWFRGWRDAFVQYAFLNVTAAAMTYIISFVLIEFGKTIPATIQLQDIATIGAQYMIILLVSIYGAFQIPSINNSIFAGRSGEGVVSVRSIR